MTASMFVVNVEAVIQRGGRFLMIERGGVESHGVGWLTFPGGTVEWDGEGSDVLERTAAREVHEEVGLKVNGPWHHVENKVFAIDALHVLDVVLMARCVVGEPSIAAPEEVAAIAWMTAPATVGRPLLRTDTPAMGGAPRSADVGRAVGPDRGAKTALDRACRPLTCDH